MDTCEHKFVYGGIKYKDGLYSLPGTGAHSREYFDWFYCEKCLENKYVELSKRGDTYSLWFDAKPMGR